MLDILHLNVAQDLVKCKALIGHGINWRYAAYHSKDSPCCGNGCREGFCVLAYAKNAKSSALGDQHYGDDSHEGCLAVNQEMRALPEGQGNIQVPGADGKGNHRTHESLESKAGLFSYVEVLIISVNNVLLQTQRGRTPDRTQSLFDDRTAS